MNSMMHARSRVKISSAGNGKRTHHRRPFGEGVFAQVEPRELGPDWRSDVAALMRGLRYTPVAIADGLEWLRTHGSAAGCPSIDPEDRDAVSQVYDAHTREDLRHATPARIPAEPRGPSRADREWLCEHDARSVVGRSMIHPIVAEALAAGRRSPEPAREPSPRPLADLLAYQSGIHENLLELVRDGLDRSPEYLDAFAELVATNREIARLTGRPFFG